MSPMVYYLSIMEVARSHQGPLHLVLSFGQGAMTLNRSAAYVRMTGLHLAHRPVGGWAHRFVKSFRKEKVCVLQLSPTSPFR